MTKWLTVSKVPELVELFGGQIDDLCGKHSVLVRKRKDGRHSLLFRSIMAETVGDNAVANQSAVGGCDDLSRVLETTEVIWARHSTVGNTQFRDGQTQYDI